MIEGSRRRLTGTDFVRLEGVSLIDPALGTVRAGTTIDIRRGLVTAVSTSDVDDREHGLEVVDGRGLFVCPGLFDSHVHYSGADDGALYVANGVTAVRNMWGTEWHLDHVRNTAGELEPALHTTSPVIDGPTDLTSATWPGVLRCESYADGVRTATRLVESGFRSLKIYSNLGRDALAGICEAARNYDVMVVGHCPNAVTFEEAARLGVSCIEHLENVETGHLKPEYRRVLHSLRGRATALGAERVAVEAMKIRMDGVDFGLIEEMADELAASGVAVCPTLMVYRMMFQSPESALADPNLQYISAERVVQWHPRNDFRLAPLVPVWPEVVELARRRFDLYVEITGLLHSRGVRIVAGTDAPNPFLVPGFSLHQELAVLVMAGLTPLEALRCATSAPLDHFAVGVDKRAGALHVGAPADLLLIDENPLTSLRALRRPRGVVSQGVYLSRADLDEVLRGEQRSWPRSDNKLGEHRADERTSIRHAHDQSLARARSQPPE